MKPEGPSTYKNTESLSTFESMVEIINAEHKNDSKIVVDEKN